MNTPNTETRPQRRTIYHWIIRSSISPSLSRVAAVGAVAAMGAGVLPAIFQDDIWKQNVTVSSASEIANIAKSLNDLRQQNDVLAKQINSTAPLKPVTSTEYKDLIKRQNTLSARLSLIEKVILESPSKALEIPMLRRDIDSNRLGNTEAVASIQHSVDRVYDQNKYVMITIAVSIILLAVSTFVKAGKS